MARSEVVRSVLRAAAARQPRDRLRQWLSPTADAVLLRKEIAALPPIEQGGDAATQEWARYREQLRDQMAAKDPAYFLTWPVLQHTMVVPSTAPYVLQHELPAIRAAGWLPLLAEDLVGGPSLIAGTSTSGNMVHHAYHLLRFEVATGIQAASYDAVTEFGAGYGSMARLLYRLSAGRIIVDMVDVPEFAALQRHYMRSIGVPLDRLDASTQQWQSSSRLLIGTWSLSEVSVSTRQTFFQSAGRFDGFLIGYQERFGGVENQEFFDGLVETSEDVEWRKEPVEHLPGNFYLFGVRRSGSQMASTGTPSGE